jgi:hypothetical protein
MKLLSCGARILRRRSRSDGGRSVFLLTAVVPRTDLPPRPPHPRRTFRIARAPNNPFIFFALTHGARATCLALPAGTVIRHRRCATAERLPSAVEVPPEPGSQTGQEETAFVSGRQERAPSLLCRENELGRPWDGRGDRVGASSLGLPTGLPPIKRRDGAGKTLVSGWGLQPMSGSGEKPRLEPGRPLAGTPCSCLR